MPLAHRRQPHGSNSSPLLYRAASKPSAVRPYPQHRPPRHPLTPLRLCRQFSKNTPGKPTSRRLSPLTSPASPELAPTSEVSAFARPSPAPGCSQATRPAAQPAARGAALRARRLLQAPCAPRVLQHVQAPAWEPGSCGPRRDLNAAAGFAVGSRGCPAPGLFRLAEASSGESWPRSPVPAPKAAAGG